MPLPAPAPAAKRSRAVRSVCVLSSVLRMLPHRAFVFAALWLFVGYLSPASRVHRVPKIEILWTIGRYT